MDSKARVRQIVVYSIITMIIASFQVSFPSMISWNNQIADLMFVFVVLVSYMFGFLDGAIVAVIVGLLRDYYAGPSIIGIDGNPTQTVGLGVLVLFVAAAISSSFFTTKMHRNAPFAFLSIVACTLIYKIVGHSIIAFWSVAVVKNSTVLTMKQIIIDSILPQLLVNVIATVPLYLLLRFAGPYSKGVNPMLNKAKEGGETWLTI